MHAEALRLLEDHCNDGASVLDVGSGMYFAIRACVRLMVQLDMQSVSRYLIEYISHLCHCERISSSMDHPRLSSMD